MLTDIHIRDFAIIDEVELSLDSGLTVLTGETGAGKSILVGALGLALGDRADTGVVRPGATRAEVTAVFDISGLANVSAWLAEHDMEADGECVLRRVVAREGRSRAWINGTGVPLNQLRELGQKLADIHGQHEHQSLLRRDVQRAIIDALGGHDAALTAVAGAFDEWRQLRDACEALRAAAGERDSRLDYLSFQVRELDALGLEPGELEALQSEQQRTSHQERLHAGAVEALDLTVDREGFAAYELITRAERAISALTDIDPRLAEPLELIAGASIGLTEAADQLRHYLDDLEVDPERSTWVEGRIGSAHELARKHRVEAAELPQHAASLSAELEALQNAGSRLEALQSELAAAEKTYLQRAATLTRRRRAAAKKLSAGVTAAMQELGMSGGHFDAALSARDRNAFTRDGLDQVDFLVSANPGQPAGAIAKVASGGELSRISLAVEVVAANALAMPCMVFDEVDAGVGGGVAEIVGQRLRALGSGCQVLCVTHLPQVASQANHHVRVAKLTDGKTTRTSLVALNDDERVEELARMLGGVTITKATQAHARDMIARARA